MKRDDLTNESLIEILDEADRFACEALSAYTHKIGMLDMGRGRFKEEQSFMEAVSELQGKLRIVKDRLKTNDS